MSREEFRRMLIQQAQQTKKYELGVSKAYMRQDYVYKKAIQAQYQNTIRRSL